MIGQEPYVAPPSGGLAFRPIRVTRTTALPDALHQELNCGSEKWDEGVTDVGDAVVKHLTAKMGLFEEIERAWFTVDNKLFLWNYNDGFVDRLQRSVWWSR